MKLYILRMRPEVCEYDTILKLLIRAPDEAWARSAAMLACASEHFYGTPPWQDASQTTCEEVTVNGPAGVLIKYMLHG